MSFELLKPREVDLLLRLPFGRAAKFAREGKLPHVVLPDGEIRFEEAEIEALLKHHRQGKEPAVAVA
jgi:predicted site-specific integrase-resolvase